MADSDPNPFPSEETTMVTETESDASADTADAVDETAAQAPPPADDEHAEPLSV